MRLLQDIITREHQVNLEDDKKTKIIRSVVKLIPMMNLDASMSPLVNFMVDLDWQLSVIPESLKLLWNSLQNLINVLHFVGKVSSWHQEKISGASITYALRSSDSGSEWLLNGIHSLDYYDSCHEVLKQKNCYIQRKFKRTVASSNTL